ncbi:hypothetical protein [Pantoea sp. 18069]|uniref:hypothetical protein n=1 Tax=Pantoea sp. 18069 TaxID=2681415 RepID=UPI001359727C|nr:hypothetical protein [Pantoea sp. 18069]
MRSPLPHLRPAARKRAAAPAWAGGRAGAQRLLWWLVLAMLFAPALGRIHQVLHPPAWQGQLAPGHAHSHAGAQVQNGAGESACGAWLAALFSGHGQADCQLHDQLNAWASPPAAGQPLPAALPQEPPRHVPGRTASAGSAAFFDPRAPPGAA